MAQSDSRRLFMVLPHLYPNLQRCKDWELYDKGGKEGTQFAWFNKDIAPPTDKELLDGKRGALTQYWWMVLRSVRNKLLKASDVYALPDRPDRDKWLPYRKKLRDLPAMVEPSSFEVINNESVQETKIGIENLMPTKPS